MGEYAKRKNDGAEVKVGVCEEMFGLRYEDRNAVVDYKGENPWADAEGLWWRLPLPEEDHIMPGDYDKPGVYPLHGFQDFIDFSDGEYNPGIVQMTHPMGLLVNLPCYHGAKLPEIKGDHEYAKVFWNGHDGDVYVLNAIKNVGGKMVPIVSCKYCRSSWSFSMESVLPYIHDEELKARLIAYNAEPEPEPKVIRRGSMDWQEMFT